jgi:hypothetical protein
MIKTTGTNLKLEYIPKQPAITFDHLVTLSLVAFHRHIYNSPKLGSEYRLGLMIAIGLSSLQICGILSTVCLCATNMVAQAEPPTCDICRPLLVKARRLARTSSASYPHLAKIQLLAWTIDALAAFGLGQPRDGGAQRF